MFLRLASNFYPKPPSLCLKDDFQSVLPSLGTLMSVSLTLRINVIRYGPHTLSLRPFKFFFQQFHCFLQLWSCFIKWYEKEWSMKLQIHNGSWHETLNFLHVSCCKMLHFVMSYMKHYKKRKQTLESVEYRLEIIFRVQNDVKILSWRNSPRSKMNKNAHIT